MENSDWAKESGKLLKGSNVDEREEDFGWQIE
jgi:hypothetical protein